MTGYLRRLATTGAAYTASSVISKLIAVALLPLYTRHLETADYGAAELLFAAVVTASIVVRLGLIESVLRFYYRDDEDPDRVVAATFSGLFWFSTIGAFSICLRTSSRRFCASSASRFWRASGVSFGSDAGASPPPFALGPLGPPGPRPEAPAADFGDLRAAPR